MTDDFRTILSIFLGLGLSAACGFRVFVPLLILSVAAHFEKVPVISGYEWIGSWPVMLALSIAVVAEIVAYYVPWFDNFMDSLSTPAATVAGILASGAVFYDLDPWMRWGLAIVAGGGVALTTQLSTVKLRALSSLLTGGVANPIISTIEAVLAVLMAIISIVLPILAFMIVLAICVASFFIIRKIWRMMAPREKTLPPIPAA